jgi:ribonuclease HI
MKLVWECQQTMCALSSWNKVMLLRAPGHREIQGNEDVDILAKEGLRVHSLVPNKQF